MRKLTILITVILICVMSLGGCLPLAEALSAQNAGNGNANSGGVSVENAGSSTTLETDPDAPVFPSETNSHVKDFLIDETDQTSPFFESILPAIAENIETNNTPTWRPSRR